MRKFKVNSSLFKMSKTKIIGLSIVLFILSVVAFSFALFSFEDSSSFVDTVADATIKLDVFVNGRVSNEFPVNDGHSEFLSYDCVNATDGTWDNTNWSLNIYFISRDWCTVFFERVYKEKLLAGNYPVLNSGFIPVIIESDGTIKKADTAEEWYKYEDSEWANAVTVNSDSLRGADAGTVIPMENIEEMFVWIPRYAYDSESIIDADHAIDITFVDTETEAHPAFEVNDIPLKGLWVGKFELGFKDGEDEKTKDSKYVIKPNLNSVHSTNISSLFYNVVDMNKTNELDSKTDIHMIKNTEWGSVAYLSQSVYGVCSSVDSCEKIENNNYYNESSKDIVTGCGGVDSMVISADSGISICPESNRWNTVNGVAASTTRNITGIYDMAGGRNEYVMGNMLNTEGSFYSSSAKFSSAPLPRYYDSYENSVDYTWNNFTRGIIGDATFEMKPNESGNVNWNGDSVSFVFSSYSWFTRGGNASDEAGAGIWYFDCSSGYDNSGSSTRATAWPYE